MEKTLYLLTGCTAAGKTELALEWAERFGGEVISCDSMLVYRGMEIGTAKPTARDRSRVPHHLIDLVPVDEPFSVGRYLPLARRAVDDVVARGRRPLVVGGSGFYLAGFLESVVDDVEVDAATRRRVREVERSGGADGLVEALRRVNPGGLPPMDLKNPRRVARALERCWASGKSLEQLEAAFRRRPSPYPDFVKKVCVLDRSREELERRIEVRARRMVESGLVEEVRRLRDEGITRNPPAARAIGYRETLAWLDNPDLESPEALIAAIAANTRKLVKKQRTWFRGRLPRARRVDAGAAGVDALF